MPTPAFPHLLAPLDLGFTTIQPAEFMKFAMCIWLPSSLHACSKMYHKKGIKAYAAPLALYAIGVALVMGGNGALWPDSSLTRVSQQILANYSDGLRVVAEPDWTAKAKR